MDPAGNSEEVNLSILYEDPDTDEGRREVEETIENIRRELGVSIESHPLSELDSIRQRSLVYLLAVLKSPAAVRVVDEAPKRGAQLVGKLPLEHVATRIAEKVKGTGCRELILYYRKTPGIYREEQDDAWRLAMLVENLSGIPVTPSDTPELGGDCIVVATLSKSSLTTEAHAAATMYGKKVVADSILELVSGDLPQLIRRALRASGIII